VTTLSGILTSDQITSLIKTASANYNAPAVSLQNQEKPIKDQISALGKVQDSLASLQSAIADLADVQTLTQRSVTTSPSGVVQATATNDAATGTYTLANIQLAQAESLLSAGFASTSGSLGAGSLTIQVGSGTAQTVQIAAGQDTLSGIADAINRAALGVQASVLFDGTAYHLLLAGNDTGAANAFTVSGSGGLAGLSYGNGGSGLTQQQAARDASFSLNGVAITSGSNSVSGVLPGLSLTLAASGSATVTVSGSIGALDKAANDVVTALNNTLATIAKYASYSTKDGAGPLLGDVGLEIIRSNLLNAISNPTAKGLPKDAAYPSLASIGFSITSGGTVTLDDAAFQAAAQADYGGVAALLGHGALASNAGVTVEDSGTAKAGRYAVNITSNDAGTLVGTVNGQAASGTDGVLVVTGAGPAEGLALAIAPGLTGDLGDVTVSQGLYGTLNDILNSALSVSGGTITGELDDLNTTISKMDDDIAALQKQAQQETLALTQQYGNAQATLSQLQTVNSFLTTYFNQLYGNSGA
jgi:flagellar hook-associated protein 2